MDTCDRPREDGLEALAGLISTAQLGNATPDASPEVVIVKYQLSDRNNHKVYSG